jgi:hypothetical protein
MKVTMCGQSDDISTFTIDGERCPDDYSKKRIRFATPNGDVFEVEHEHNGSGWMTSITLPEGTKAHLEVFSREEGWRREEDSREEG